MLIIQKIFLTKFILPEISNTHFYIFLSKYIFNTKLIDIFLRFIIFFKQTASITIRMLYINSNINSSNIWYHIFICKNERKI